MKEIQPISIWYNGQELFATILNCSVTANNLFNNATFNYSLLTTNSINLTSGYLNITGDDYISYTTNSDSNTYAFTWIANQLNITLL